MKEAGLTKAEIRDYSAKFGLPTAEKPQMACLSSRIPYGEKVTPEKLRMIEAAENALRDLGFFDVRVRHHELKNGHLARIEIGPDEMARVFQNGAFGKSGRSLQGSRLHTRHRGFGRVSAGEFECGVKNSDSLKV